MLEQHFSLTLGAAPKGQTHKLPLLLDFVTATGLCGYFELKHITFGFLYWCFREEQNYCRNNSAC